MESPFESRGLPCTTYSIKQEFSGATVFVTGASGYLGSLLVEQLLRTTDVRRIYVLMRGKRGCPATERLQRILYGGLFHLVRDDASLLSKVHMLEGDLQDDNLGLSPADRQKLESEAEIVLHSAASIELEADVQHTLKSNYLGTKRLLTLASRMKRLRSFVHLSTAYVNINHPRGSSIQERIYPLMLGQQEVRHEQVVEDLLSLEATAANVRAQMFLDLWDFPNTYTLGKHLTEQLVALYHAHGLPLSIVRPTLVCGLAGAPYPGYCGNLAGPIGMGVATAIGLFDCLESVAMVPTHVWDVVPGDMVTSVVLAAAAATCAGIQINEYTDSPIGSNKHPMIVHAGTSTTYPISFVEASWASAQIVKNNPPPFKLPGSSLFQVPLNYRPNEQAVEKRKYWTAWKVYIAVQLLELLGQHKTARRLKYGHMAWAIQNSSKTDRHLFFCTKNLRALADHLDAADAGCGEYTVTWTLKNGGWPRYIATNLAGMYRQVFGMNELKNIAVHDFKFIPAKPLDAAAAAAFAKTQQEEQPCLRPPTPESSTSSFHREDLVEAGLKNTASQYASIPASGASLDNLAAQHGAQTTNIHAFTGHIQQDLPAGQRILPTVKSADVGGIRAAIAHKLASTMSYQPAPAEAQDVDVKPVRDTAPRDGRLKKND